MNGLFGGLKLGQIDENSNQSEGGSSRRSKRDSERPPLVKIPINPLAGLMSAKPKSSNDPRASAVSPSSGMGSSGGPSAMMAALGKKLGTEFTKN